MASIFWNDLNNGDVIDIDAVGFDPAIDRIIISNDAMHLGGWTWTGANNTDFYMSITYNGVTKAVTFAGLASREFAADTLYFSNGDKFYVGDMLATTDGDDDDNIITGGAGRDVLSGLGGDDTLLGGDGDDRLLGYSGNDLIDGGGGFDQAMYSSKVTDPVNASLATGHGYQSGYVDTYLNIEGLRGSAGNDYLIGNNASNYLGGGMVMTGWSAGQVRTRLPET